MAGATIDNINIVATADVSNAVKEISKLQSQLSGLKGTATKAAPAMKETEKAVKNAGNTAKHAASGIEKLGAALKRVIVYRMLRGAIKSVTQAFSEGVKNAYAWAEAHQDAFKQVMDTYATRTNYLKNTLGALASTVLTSLLPAFKQVTDWLIQGINYVNEFIAAIKGAFTGDYSYLRAKEVAVDFADATEDAANAQKKLNQQLMKFDELNVITTPKNAASSEDTPNWMDAFERVEASDFMKNNWQWIAGTAVAGTGLAYVLTHWVGNALSVAVSNAMLGGGGQLGLATLITQAASLVGGIVLMLGGVSLSLDAAHSFLSGDNLKGFVEMVGGALASGLGGTLISTAFGASGPLGFVIGAGLSIFATLVGLEVERPKTSGEQLFEDIIVNGTYVNPNGGNLNIHRRGDGLGTGSVGNSTNGAKNINYSGTLNSNGEITPNLKKFLKPEDYGVTYLASGGFPSMGSVFVAGEIPGSAEMVGTINGRTGVASGEEITGISEAVYSTGGETNTLLRELISVAAAGGMGKPSAAFGRYCSQSLSLYKGVTG